MMYNLRRHDALARGGGRGVYSTFERSKSPARRRSSASAPASRPLHRRRHRPAMRSFCPPGAGGSTCSSRAWPSLRRRSWQHFSSSLWLYCYWPLRTSAVVVDKQIIVDEPRSHQVIMLLIVMEFGPAGRTYAHSAARTKLFRNCFRSRSVLG